MPTSVRCGNVQKNLKYSRMPARATTMTPIFVISLVLLGLSCPSLADYSRPDYVQCQSNLECDPGYCCSIGPTRYSAPKCKPMQEEGEVCRPGSTSMINVTVLYPDRAQVLLTDVYYILCPCAEGLTCDAKEGVCRDNGEKHDPNLLFDEKNEQDV